MRLGIVGAGSIVPFHIAAAIEVGFIPVLICGKQGSQNAIRISETCESLTPVDSFSDIMEADLDAILIATSTSSLFPILLDAIEKNVPILIEKPVTTDLSAFEKIPKSAYNRIIVGYNRRHYPSVQELKAIVEGEEGCGLIQILIPELATNPIGTEIQRRSALLENATHILDLVHFVFGPITVTGTERLSDKFGTKFILTNFTSSNLRFGTIAVTNGVPESPRISFWTGSKSLDLSPIEKLQVSIGMERIEPTLINPIAKYEKQYLDNSTSIQDPRFKPGFIGQYLEFFTLAQGNRHGFDSATIRDAQRAVLFAQSLLD